MTTEHFGDYPYASRYEELVDPWNSDLGVKRVAQDPAGICISVMPKVGPDVKVLAIARHQGGEYSKGTYEDVVSGKYPYFHYIYFYVNRAPGKPLDPFVKEYLRMVLSREGQQALTDEPKGFLPLTAKEVEEELRKLE
jgi:phosphate transport system substrate-binding protein